VGHAADNKGRLPVHRRLHRPGLDPSPDHRGPLRRRHATLATYLRADLQAGRRQGDFHYAHEEMAMSMVISATLGAMNLLVEDGEVEHADRIAAEVVLQALGGP
tara:strand:- start:4506 stop:4817 length:312 start_codon:yes stop_codon:yes gene_type:complete